MTNRDYGLFGADGKRAVETGLAAAEWYHSEISRKDMKALMKRDDQPAIRDTFILYICMIAFAGIGIALWPSWWSAPFWLAYGVLYGSASDSRWHECGHGTAFKTPWMNTVVYQIASFMMVRNPFEWRWSHFRHHTDTIIVGRDPEIVFMRPPHVARIASNFFGIADAWHGWVTMLKNAAGMIDEEVRTFVPDVDQPKLILTARIWTAIYAAIIALAVATGSILPLMVIGLPRLYGAWHHVMTGILQHAGLAENVLDHRLNSRTVLMNPISRFIYWNMNYHVEHHMFPMVPYHRLPELHEKIKHDLQAPNRSIRQAYAEAWPYLVRQFRGEEVCLRRELPSSAKPYREDLDGDAPGVPAQ
jgi:fatty acid desaturase